MAPDAYIVGDCGSSYAVSQGIYNSYQCMLRREYAANLLGGGETLVLLCTVEA